MMPIVLGLDVKNSGRWTLQNASEKGISQQFPGQCSVIPFTEGHHLGDESDCVIKPFFRAAPPEHTSGNRNQRRTEIFRDRNPRVAFRTHICWHAHAHRIPSLLDREFSSNYRQMHPHKKGAEGAVRYFHITACGATSSSPAGLWRRNRLPAGFWGPGARLLPSGRARGRGAFLPRGRLPGLNGPWRNRAFDE